MGNEGSLFYFHLRRDKKGIGENGVRREKTGKKPAVNDVSLKISRK